MNGFVNCSARLLVAGLTAGLLAPLPAATIAFSYDVTGTSGSTKVNSTTVDYEATATGSATPLGTANFTTVGVLRATSSNTGTITGTLTCTFGNGDSIQGSYSQVPFSLGASGSGSSTGNATITGGTGGFKNATGSMSFNYSGVSAGKGASTFTLTGSGTITTSSASSGVLAVSPPALTFSFVQGSATPGWQPIVVTNGLQQAETFAVQVSGGPWLSASPVDGMVQASANASVIASADPTGLNAGTYSGTITITSSAGGPFQVPVTLTISAAPSGILVSQTGLLFTAAAGSMPPPGQTVPIVNPNSGTVDWNAAVTSATNWLSVTPSAGSSSSTSSGTVTISVDPSNLQAGSYYGVVQVTPSNGLPQSVVIVASITSTPPGPSVLPTGLAFAASQNGALPGQQVVTLDNPSSASLNVSVGTIYLQAGGWLSVNPPSATIAGSQSTGFDVTVNPAGLQTGVYNGLLEFEFADGSTQDVSVVLVVSPGSATAATAVNGRPAKPAASCAATRLLPVSTLLGQGYQVSAAWPVAMDILVLDDCGEPMTSGIVAVSFSNGDAEISLLSLGNGHWTGTWQPSDANAAQLVITVLAQSVQPQLTGTEQISGAVKPNPGVPTVNPGGVVGAASLAPLIPVAPGDLVAIFGANLAGALVQSRNLPLATELGNTQATLAGQPMPLMFAAGGQVNAMVPYGLPPNTVQQIVVQYNQAYSLPQPVTIAPALPGVFNKNGVGIIVVVKPDHTQFIADANHPASAGDTLIIYCAGLGPVSPPVAAGSAAPLSPLSKTTNTVLATIGRQNATITFSGLTPTLAGLYQVNAKVPAGITSGPAVPIVLTVAGASSPPVTIAIQ